MGEETGLKILFILPEYYPHSGGGIATYYQHYLAALQSYCAEIKVIVGSGHVQSQDQFEHDGISVEYLNPTIYAQYVAQFSRFDLLPDYRNNLAAAWAMWQQANYGEGFDIIECTDFGLGFVPWVINHTKPVITRLHGSSAQIALHENADARGLLSHLYSQTELSLLPLCDSLITHSPANQCFWQQLLPQSLINYALPVYHRGQHNAVPYRQRDNKGLVTARIQKWKGPEILCAAVPLLKASVEIQWIGRDMPYDNHTSTAEYLSDQFPQVWGKAITPDEPKPNTEIQYIQQRAKFGLIPSVWDMFNFTCIEFMAAGTPVICADGAGASVLIEHGKNGLTYAANDAQALADCIDTLTNLNENDYQQMAQAGMDTIDNELSPDKLIPVYLQYYTDAIDNFKPSAANVYLTENYSPSGAVSLQADVLDKLPLRSLTRYLYRRVTAKISSR
ncbi:hypothetical protein GCM10023149_32190 [Mucilaginibacter gynuensis]|uniref:Glycosyltransferase involved in cell wall biosynthesis n=1 Tax=Mucilaginibacter gynuensis TaxID=1302236 RepID=A0ABP8GQ18_9SPHI